MEFYRSRSARMILVVVTILLFSGPFIFGTLKPTSVVAVSGLTDIESAAASVSPVNEQVALQVAHLRVKLKRELNRLEHAYSSFDAGGVLEPFVTRGKGMAAQLGARLTSVYLNDSATPFVVGVTGGSSTAKRTGWTILVRRWLNETAGISKVHVRNAAQGSTSQLVTAPCIRSLVGDGIDLLLWEFAMNDEYEFVQNDAPPEYPLRRRVAETFLRQAIALNPGVIGFVHLWDITIQRYKGGLPVPNKAYAPTNAVAKEYEAVFDRFFSYDTIGAMTALRLYREKTEFLSDRHHPNDAGHKVIADLLVYVIAHAWMAYLNQGTNAVSINDPGPRPDLWRFPILSSSGQPPVLPEQHLFGHCIMSMPPQFATNNSIVQLSADGKVDCSSIGACSTLADTGKADPNRADRKQTFVVPKCSEDGCGGGLLFRAEVSNIAYILIDCGHNKGAECLKNVTVHLNNRRVLPNRSVTGDILSSYYAWVHEITNINSTVNSHAGALTPYYVRICPTEDTATFSRLVLLERVFSE